MSDHVASSARTICFALMSVFLSSPATAQGIPDDTNVNIIGINPPGVPDPGWVPIADTGNKQQNEAACSHKPAFPLHIICVFNDYRAVDLPPINDAWEGWAWSINGGQTFFSDLLPGHPGDSPNLGLDFAADPQVTAAPGVAFVTYLAAERADNGGGGLFLQRMFEVNREGGSPWAPEMLPQTIVSGNAGQFVDKPYQMLHLGPPGSGTVTVSSTLKDGSPVSQEVPAGRLFVAYTTFLKNKNKLNVAYSDDYGESWKATKLSEGQAVNQSASLAAHGDSVCAVWRRFEWKRQSNAILYSCSSNRGKTWPKSKVLSEGPEFSPFDQGTTETTFRTNSYPVIVSDGSTFYSFWTTRVGSGLFYARIVYSTSTDDGATWSTPMILDPTAPPDGHQYQVTAAVARGDIQVAWYDTRNDLFQGQFIQDLIGDIPEVNNPSDMDKVIRHQGDMRTTKIIAGIPQPSVQVSRYLHGHRSETPAGTVEKLEFNFLNDRLFKVGTVPFDGDFPHLAAPLFRLEEGEWVSNAAAGSENVPVDFFVTWTDSRDVRGNVWGDLSAPTVYTPANMTPMMTENDASETSDSDAAKNETKLAALQESSREDAVTVSDPAVVRVTGDAAKMGNEARADAEPDPAIDNPMCIPGPEGAFTYSDQSRNQNVYASVIRPGVSIDSPSASKPTGPVQRAHVIWISNNTAATVEYTITIDDQPADAPDDGRASFLQTPIAPFDVNDPTGGGLLTELEVTIERDSTIARTVFITSGLPYTPINVSVSDGGAAVLGTITLNPDILTPNVQNPNVQNTDPSNPNIQNGEVHNPNIQNDPVVISVSNPNVQNPNVQNPNVQNPNVQNPNVQNPNVQNPNVQNPNVQNEALEGSDQENPDTGYNPDPGDELTPAERTAGYTDITWDTTNTGNTTTAFNLDAFINGDTSGLKTQLIATRTQTTETSRNCTQYQQVQDQVIFNLTNPDLSLLERNTTDLVFGDGSAYIAPGEEIFITLRVWGDPFFPVDLTGVRVESQACDFDDPDLATDECDPPFAQVGSPDAPPVITVPSSPVLLEAANVLGDIGANSEEPISAVDDVDPTVDILCEAGPDSDSGTDLFDMVIFFELGDTEVTCSATDSAGNMAEETFTVRVEDTTPPVIQFGEGGSSDYVFAICDTATPPYTYNVDYQSDDDHVTVFDEVDDSPTLSCDPASGGNETVFEPPSAGEDGVTEVSCESEDFSDNFAEDTFNVITRLVFCIP